MKNLFIIVHPDDESIGCGALINKLYKEGDENTVVVMCIQNFSSLRKGETIYSSERIEDLKKSLTILNGNSDYISFTDKSLSCIDEYEIVGFIDKITKNVQPDRVFMPWKSYHHDHRITHECCLASTRISSHNKSVKQYYFYDYPFYQFNNENGMTYIVLDEDNINNCIKSCAIYSDIMDSNSIFSPSGIKHIFESRGYEITEKYADKIVLFKSIGI